MPWSDVLAQDRVVDALRRAMLSDRVAHAYLLHGPDGVGKRAVALRFAQALQCTRPQEGDACGTCAACSKVARLIHPDVHVLFPQPGDASEEDVAERVALLARNPYAIIDFTRRPSLKDASKTSNKQTTYTIERIQEDVRRPMSYRPVEGRYRVAILLDVDLLRVEAANAFLKLLEEPGPDTVFVLTTTRPDRVLATIVSRCQGLRLDLLPPEAIEATLVGQGVAPEAAPLLARMADGSLSRAFELTEQADVHAQREVILRLLREAFGRGPGLRAVLDETSKLGREQLKGLLHLLLRWTRDLVLARSLGSEAPLVNVDQRETIQRFVQNVPQANLEAMAAVAEEALGLLERNVSTGLVVRVLTERLHAAMRRGEARPLYEPLVAV